MNDHTAGYAELPRTAYLDNSLRRARTSAEQRSHRYVTLEHLLLALMDDPDAVDILHAVGADAAVIQTTISDVVNNRMSALVVPDGRAPGFSYKFDTLFLGASQDAVQVGRRVIDGGLALIAIAKDPGSHAANVLATGGFHAQAALSALAGAGGEEPLAEIPQTQGTQIAAGDSLMDNMLATVRNIIDEEERKDRALPHGGHQPIQPRFEPQLRAEPAAGNNWPRVGTDMRTAPLHGQQPTEPPYRTEPSLGFPPAQTPYRQPPPAVRVPASAESTPAQHPDAALPPHQPQPERRRKRDGNSARGKGETPGLVVKLLEKFPKKTRIGMAETVQIRISKEEAGSIFGQGARRGPPQQTAETHAACRAVTIRLLAPDGGFFIEPATPETQWLLDRPSFLGDESFGTWAWTILPGETGSYFLTLTMSARDVDGNGLAGDVNIPGQTIKIRVGGNIWSALWAVLRTILLLLAGCGLAVGAYFALKMLGKLPHDVR